MILDKLDNMLGYIMICLNAEETEEFLDLVPNETIHHMEGVLYYHNVTQAIITVDRGVYVRRDSNN